MIKLLALLALVSIAIAAPDDHLVESLPKFNDGKPFPFKMYSGYLQVADSTRNLHYVYVESQKDPVNDPVMVWFNGGPGCSSMLGFIQEHGPYVIEDGEYTFHTNDYSWNKEMNMLYIESPVQVGYSYYIKDGDFNYTDDAVARDNLYALIYFFAFLFPERQSNDLWLSGESYAGIYVPYLAWQIDQYNAKKELVNGQLFTLNMKGFIVGNGVANWKYDTIPAYIETAYWHALYDLDLYERIQSSGCKKWFEYLTFNATLMPIECQNMFLEFEYYTAGINVYNMYGPCYSENGTQSEKMSLYESNEDASTKIGNEIKKYKKTYSAHDYTPWLNIDIDRTEFQANKKITPPCTFATPIIEYFNDQEVKDKLHISNLSPEWDLCNTLINVLYTKNDTGSQWVYEALKNKYRILFYSGDVDGAVPALGSLQWIEELKWSIVKEWGPFYYNKQVAGYYEDLDGMRFMTVHGAGHMVPQDKRSQAYYAIFNWVFGRPLDDHS